MIYLTGDTHGDVSRFRAAARAGIRKRDTLIVCGDFGFVWKDSAEEQKLLRWIGKRRYRVLFVDGCNEDHARLETFPEVELLGGHARQISGNLYLLKRGEVYDIDGEKVFAFGGGIPLEQYANNLNDARLLPSPEEIDAARQRLAACGNRVDLIVTHDAPARLRQFTGVETLDEQTHLHTFFEEISRTVQFDRWYFGKYHKDRLIPPHYQMLFSTVVRHKAAK